MSDSTQPDHPNVDPERTRPHNAFDAADGYSGQDYDRDREAAEGARRTSGYALGGGAGARDADGDDGSDIGPDNGRPAAFDPATGTVIGSGAGAGGGNEGEDFDPGTPGAAGESPQAGAAPDRSAR